MRQMESKCWSKGRWSQHLDETFDIRAGMCHHPDSIDEYIWKSNRLSIWNITLQKLAGKIPSLYVPLFCNLIELTWEVHCVIWKSLYISYNYRYFKFCSFSISYYRPQLILHTVLFNICLRYTLTLIFDNVCKILAIRNTQDYKTRISYDVYFKLLKGVVQIDHLKWLHYCV